MIVVADTSVILNLCCVEQQELLLSLFSDVLIPPEVRMEFERAATVFPRFAGLTVPNWAREQAPRAVPPSLRQVANLDPGETAAIVTLEARSNRLADTRPLMPKVLAILPTLRPGTLTVISA